MSLQTGSPDAPPEPEVTTLSVVIPSTHERSAMVLSAVSPERCEITVR